MSLIPSEPPPSYNEAISSNLKILYVHEICELFNKGIRPKNMSIFDFCEIKVFKTNFDYSYKRSFCICFKNLAFEEMYPNGEFFPTHPEQELTLGWIVLILKRNDPMYQTFLQHGQIKVSNKVFDKLKEKINQL